MKAFITLAIAALAAASPVELSGRQLGSRVGTTATEFTDGGCRDIVMLFARGSAEAGNMGSICGPPTANGVKDNFGAENVAVEGIDYAARLSTNFGNGGADRRGVAEMERLIGEVNSQCPNSTLVVGGYSQGAALTHRAVEGLPQEQKDQIAAAFTFGDTQNQQDNEQIPNFPPERTNIICNAGDAVCSGSLTILPPHLNYGGSRSEAQVEFITQQLQAAGAKLKKRS